MPLRGVIGSDIQKYRNDWQVIENPMKSSGNKNEPILLLPAVQLDVLIFHAPCVDKNGNIQIGRRRELATLAHASKKVFVTTEQILDIDFFDDELSAATCLPHYMLMEYRLLKMERGHALYLEFMVQIMMK